MTSTCTRVKPVRQLFRERRVGTQSLPPGVKLPSLRHQELRLIFQTRQSRVCHVSRARSSQARVMAVASETGADDEWVTVQFVLVRECCFGQSFFVAGSSPALGEWDLGKAVPMQWSEGHVWSATARMSTGELVAAEFKFVKMGEEEVYWQPSANHSLADGTGPDVASPEQENLIIMQRSWEGELLPPLPEALLGGSASEASVELVQAAAAVSAAAGSGAVGGERRGPPRVGGNGRDTRERGKRPSVGPAATGGSSNGAALASGTSRTEQTTNGAARRSRQQGPDSPLVQTLTKDKEWAEKALSRLLGSWGRKPLMAEEEERK